MPYTKRTYGRPYRSYKKTYRSYTKKKPLTKVIDKAIAKKAELKLWDYNNGVDGQLINKSVPVILNLMNPEKGDDYFERNGNTINLSSMLLRISVFIKSGVIARFILFKSKVDGEDPAWNPDLVRVDAHNSTNIQYNIYGVPAIAYNEEVKILKDWTVTGGDGTGTSAKVIRCMLNLKDTKYQFEKDETTFPMGRIYLAMVASHDSDLSPLVYVNSEVRFRDI